MKTILGAFAAALMMMTAQVASASTTFNFSFANPAGAMNAFTGSGTLTATDDPIEDDGAFFYAIDQIGGSVSFNGSVRAITGLLTAPNEPFFNVVVSNDSFTGIGLLGFDFVGGSVIFSLQESGDYLATGAIDGMDGSIANIALDVAAVPEPATWGMMLLGFAIVGAAMRRRRVSVAFAA